MKNDTTFVPMRSGDQLGDAKLSKKGTSLRRINLFINCDTERIGLLLIVATALPRVTAGG